MAGPPADVAGMVQGPAIGLMVVGGIGILFGLFGLAMCVLGMGMSGPALIATDAAIGMMTSIIKAVMFSSFDLLDQSGFIVGLLVGAATIPGAFVARWMITNLSANVHVWIIETMVVIAGVSFLWRAINW